MPLKETRIGVSCIHNLGAAPKRKSAPGGMAGQLHRGRSRVTYGEIFCGATDMNRSSGGAKTLWLIILASGLGRSADSADMTLPVREQNPLRVERLALPCG